MLEPERPEAVVPDRALCLPTFSPFLMVNKSSLSLSLSFSLPPSLSFYITTHLSTTVEDEHKNPFHYFFSLTLSLNPSLARSHSRSLKGLQAEKASLGCLVSKPANSFLMSSPGTIIKQRPYCVCVCVCVCVFVLVALLYK
jgi:hypothetical protein